MLAGTFSPQSVRKLEPIFQAKAKEVSLLFDRAITGGEDGRTGIINTTEIFTKLSLDIIGKTVLGVNLNHLESTKGNGSSGPKEYTFYDAYNAIFAPGTLGNVLLFASGHFPVRWLPLEANRNFLQASSWLNQVLTSLIRQRTAQVATAARSKIMEGKESRDLLTFLVEESMPGGAAEGIPEDIFVGDVSVLSLKFPTTTPD
jgi:cytochrome P450